MKHLLTFGVGILIIILGGWVLSTLIGHRLPHQLGLSSSAFRDNQPLPALYTCDGENIAPPLEFLQVPATAKSFAVLMEDTTTAQAVAHWITWNIPAQTSVIQEGIRPAGTVARSYAGNFGYSGPCPNPGSKHSYLIHLYALKVSQLSINSSATLADFQKAITSNVLDEASLTTTYQRVKK